MDKRPLVVATAAACLVAACGSAAAPGASSNSSANPSAATSPKQQVLIVVAEEPSGGYQSAPTPVRLMRPDGTEAVRLVIKQGARVARAAGSRVFVLEENGALKAVHKDGSVEDLGRLGDRPPGEFMVSPDGRRWMWDTNGGQTTQVHVAGDGLAPRVVAGSRRCPSDRAVLLDPGGRLPRRYASGHWRLILFDPARGPIQRLDLTSSKTSPVPYTDHCAFSDMARDGTIACFRQAPTRTRAA